MSRKKIVMDKRVKSMLMNKQKRTVRKLPTFNTKVHLYKVKNAFNDKRLVIKNGVPNQRIIARCEYVKEIRIQEISEDLIYSGDPNLDYYAYTADKNKEILIDEVIDTNNVTYFICWEKITNETLKEDIYVLAHQKVIKDGVGQRGINCTLAPLDSLELGDNSFFEIIVKEAPFSPGFNKTIDKIRIKTDGNWILQYFDTGDPGDNLVNGAPFKLTIGKDNNDKFTFNNTWANNRYILPLSKLWKGNNEEQDLRQYFPEEYAWNLILKLLTLSYNVKVNWTDISFDVIDKTKAKTQSIGEYWSDALQNRQPSEIANKLLGLVREEIDRWYKGYYSTYFFFEGAYTTVDIFETRTQTEYIGGSYSQKEYQVKVGTKKVYAGTKLNHNYKWGKIVQMSEIPSKKEIEAVVDKVKAFCIMLSQDMVSPFALQGGLNDYMKWLLPYSLTVKTIPELHKASGSEELGDAGIWMYDQGKPVMIKLISSHIEFDPKLPDEIQKILSVAYQTKVITGGSNDKIQLVDYRIAQKAENLPGMRDWEGLLFATDYVNKGVLNAASYSADDFSYLMNANTRVVSTFWTPYPPSFNYFSRSKRNLPGAIKSKITINDINDRGYFVVGKVERGNAYNNARSLWKGIPYSPVINTIKIPLIDEIKGHITTQNLKHYKLRGNEITYNYDLVFDLVPLKLYGKSGYCDVYITNISYKLIFEPNFGDSLLIALQKLYTTKTDAELYKIMKDLLEPTWITTLSESYKSKLFNETLYMVPVTSLNMGDKVTENLNALQPNEITQIFAWLPYSENQNLIDVMSIIQNENFEIINDFKPLLEGLYDWYEITVADTKRTKYSEIKFNHIGAGKATIQFLDNEDNVFFELNTVIGSPVYQTTTETTILLEIDEEGL